MENTYKKLAKKIFELFVVNNKAVAIQQEDSKYYTKYFTYDYNLIYELLVRHGSLGCYQEDLNTGKLKWICLDFDCKDKITPDVSALYSYIKKTLLCYLEQLSINYLTEFSGRRGIHVWIIFNSYITKQLGYDIINKIISVCPLNDNYGIDLFPKTDIPAKKVGLAVKFPLSCHKDGAQSYFFENSVFDTDSKSVDFYEKQYQIMENYKLNDIKKVCSALEINSEIYLSVSKYKKIQILDDIYVTTKEIIDILSKLHIFKDIFDRLFHSIPIEQDWFVLLGTLGPIDRQNQLLLDIFSRSSKFDMELTLKKIEQWKDRYFPGTFEYIYKIYHKKCEENIDQKMTALEFLINQINAVKKTNIKFEILEINTSSALDFNTIETVIRKEKKYIEDNDEKIVIPIWNDIHNLSSFDISKIKHKINNLNDINSFDFGDKKNYCILRKEDEDKTRKLVVLNLWDRIITTYLSIQIADKINIPLTKTETFSYKIDFLSKDNIFINWYDLWSQYIDRIKTYLEIPYLQKCGVFMIDIKHFYDSIDFNYVKSYFDEKIKKKEYLQYLISYTELLMDSICNTRLGIPQGPAYARILAEIFMDCIFQDFENETKNMNFQVYRYVDDIIVFYNDIEEGEFLYKTLSNLLIKNNLHLNTEKSKNFGIISNLSSADKNLLLHKNKFNYLLQNTEYSELLSEEEKNFLYSNYINQEFDINNVSFIFSYKTNSFYQIKFYEKFHRNIFKSEFGRGSIFYKFYMFLFHNSILLETALNQNYFNYIPIGSLNFQVFISTLYLAAQKKVISTDQLSKICKSYLKTLEGKNVGVDELLIIEALCKRYDAE